MNGTDQQIRVCRQAIRRHRDAKGDDRCWLDDYRVWACIPDSPEMPSAPPPIEQAMEKCRAFYKLRSAKSPDFPGEDAILDRHHWDDDLQYMDEDEKQEELVRLQTAILRHRDAAGNPGTIHDDRDLYSVLPEKIPGDFRLPPEDDFLGEAKAPHAGCPSFWRSHAGCEAKRHNLLEWGPCRKDDDAEDV